MWREVVGALILITVSLISGAIAGYDDGHADGHQQGSRAAQVEFCTAYGWTKGECER